MKQVGWLIGFALIGATFLSQPKPAVAIPAQSDQKKINQLALDAQIQLELKFWRKPGRIRNAACSSCHSPDGLELALYQFSDHDLRRRALPHLSAEDTSHIVNLIQLLRKKYEIKALLNPMADRPLQPGGTPLEGATAEERDFAFAKSLTTIMPKTMSGEVKTLEDAHQVRDEFLKIDLANLQIGIPFNRISEDQFRGPEHASIAHWIADVPSRRTLELTSVYNQASDKYLDNPSEENLLNLLRITDVDDDRTAHKPIDAVSAQKLRSLLLFTHYKRLELLGKPVNRILDFPLAAKGVLPNPFWSIGDLARIQQDLDLLSPNPLLMTPDILAKKTGGPNFTKQVNDLILPWLWLGWIADPGLQKTTKLNIGRQGEYFSLNLWEIGPYAVHGGFFNIRHMLSVAYQPGMWNTVGPQHLHLNSLAHTRHGNQIKHEPKDPIHKKLYRTFLCNSYRMLVHLTMEQMQTTKIVWSRHITREEFGTMRTYLNYAQPEREAEDKALFDEAEKLVASTPERIR